jgi:hypothetical protein
MTPLEVLVQTRKEWSEQYYRHSKGDLYLVTDVCINSDNREKPSPAMTVLYTGIYTHPEFGALPRFARSFEEFSEPGRFTRITTEESAAAEKLYMELEQQQYEKK